MALVLLLVALFAGIANILTFLWVIFFDSKTLPQVFRDIRNGRPARANLGASNRFDSGIRILNFFLTVCIIGLLIAYFLTPPRVIHVQTTPTPISSTTFTLFTHTVTPSLIPSPTPLYEANWVTSLNGWSGGSGWSVNNGMLVNNGTYQDPTQNRNKISILTPPIQSLPANYTVVAQIQFQGQVSSSSVTVFGIILRGGSDLNKAGYFCYIFNTNVAKIKIAPDIDTQNNTPFSLGTSWHTYQAIANGTTISFYLDNTLVGEVIDNTFTAHGVVGLIDINSQINVRSFQVLPV